MARFVSADSVVPGGASGSMDGVTLKPLTVDFHEPGFATTLAGENAQPFWFQLNQEQRQQAGYAGGPLNPQALNRYAYVLNNPVNATDPSGHYGALAAVFGAAGFTISAPAIAAIAVVLTVVTVAVFLNDPNNRAWLSEQINNGIGNVTTFADSLVGKVNGTENGAVNEAQQSIPGKPFTGPDAPKRAYDHLEKRHGLDRNTARNRLYKLKEAHSLAPDDDVVIGRTGDVYNAKTGERMGSLTDPSLGKER